MILDADTKEQQIRGLVCGTITKPTESAFVTEKDQYLLAIRSKTGQRHIITARNVK